MAYHRFLTNTDYLAIVSEEQFKQLVDNHEERLSQCEQSAEMNLLEYLDQYYEIEKVLAFGKSIRDYNPMVNYPANVHFKKDGFVYRTMSPLNGLKKPTLKVYWQEIADPLFADEEETLSHKYSQLSTYSIGDIVKFVDKYYSCLIPNGYECNNIVIPGLNAWQQVEVTAWQPNMSWDNYDVCSYNNLFYMKNDEGENESDEVLTPDVDPTWWQIGNYTTNYEYNYAFGSHDYVVAENKVWLATKNPNPSKVEAGVNVMKDDPRNQNVLTHLTRISCYYLHQMVSPVNISETRRAAYEDSMAWLIAASKFKLNPHIPRKKEEDTKLPKVDWALETFQRSFDPYEDMWLT